MVTKLKWLKTNIDMRIPFEKRAVQVDTLRYDEILRMLTHLSQEDLDEIERVLTESLKGEKNISSIDSSEIPWIYEYYINSTNEYLGKNPDTYEEFVSECAVNQSFFKKWYNKAKAHYESNI